MWHEKFVLSHLICDNLISSFQISCNVVAEPLLTHLVSAFISGIYSLLLLPFLPPGQQQKHKRPHHVPEMEHSWFWLCHILTAIKTLHLLKANETNLFPPSLSLLCVLNSESIFHWWDLALDEGHCHLPVVATASMDRGGQETATVPDKILFFYFAHSTNFQIFSVVLSEALHGHTGLFTVSRYSQLSNYIIIFSVINFIVSRKYSRQCRGPKRTVLAVLVCFPI